MDPKTKNTSKHILPLRADVVKRLSSEIPRQESDITSKNINKIMSPKPGKPLEVL